MVFLMVLSCVVLGDGRIGKLGREKGLRSRFTGEIFLPVIKNNLSGPLLIRNFIC